MNRLKMYPESSRKQREFTAEEDFLILERILPRLKFKKLSTSGFLLTSDLMELAGEFHRNHGSVRQGGIKCRNRGTGFLDSEGSHR